MASRPLQFVDLSDPFDATSKEQRRRTTRSQAARAAHAEKRRLLTIQYQAQKAQDESNKARAHETESCTPTAPRILRLLPSSRKDPFLSFARPFKPVEHFLFDHCTS